MRPIDLVKAFEGFRTHAYADPASPRAKHKRATGIDDPTLSGDPWTIGYGYTGPEVREGTVWTPAQCEDKLVKRIAHDQHIIQAMCPAPRSESAMAALVSLAYNIGLRGFEHSDVRRELNLGHLLAAADAFRVYVHAKGEVDPGLVKRRERERALFLTGEGLPV